MEDNIIEKEFSTIIIDGGNVLKDCPKSWEEAHKIEDKLNENIVGSLDPRWEFDCGYKLDFDGSIISVSSRFYPPKTHYGKTWDGSVLIEIMGEEFEKKSFDCPTLEQLKLEVNRYLKEVVDKIKIALNK